MIEFKCNYCKKIFEAIIRKDRIKRYCSKKCTNLSKIKNKIIKNCITCLKLFTLKTKRGKGKFCSHKCIRYTGPKSKLGLFKGIWDVSSPAEKQIILKNRFEKSVIKKDGCWGWKKRPLISGYAPVYINNRKKINAHRLSWIIHNGIIPDKLCVLHKCDNRICTNPEHLFLGTINDNNLDMIKKGRNSKKLNNEKILEIIKLLHLNYSIRSIAKIFNISITRIYDIKNKKAWRQVAI